MKISFVRGAYLNNFEGQNYDLPLLGYSSLFPIDAHVPFPIIRMASLADIQRIKLLEKPIKFLANRTIGDSQILFGLENHVSGSDIVHIADPHYYYSYQAACLKSQGKIYKLVCTWWETIPFNNESTQAKKKIKNYTMKHIDLFLTHSNKAKKCLETEGVEPKKIQVLPLGVNIERFHPQHHKSSHRFTILFVGRFVEEKGIMDVYNAFKIIIKSEKNILLNIVGRGPLEARLRRMITDGCLENSISIENKSYREMPEVYHQANVLCVPSKTTKTWEEQYGMVFLEAMASAVPIVSYSTGAIPEVVADAGLCAKEGDVNNLAALIIQIVRSKELGIKLGTIGRERAERLFNAKLTANTINELYMSLRGTM